MVKLIFSFSHIFGRLTPSWLWPQLNSLTASAILLTFWVILLISWIFHFLHSDCLILCPLICLCVPNCECEHVWPPHVVPYSCLVPVVFYFVYYMSMSLWTLYVVPQSSWCLWWCYKWGLWWCFHHFIIWILKYLPLSLVTFLTCYQK